MIVDTVRYRFLAQFEDMGRLVNEVGEPDRARLTNERHDPGEVTWRAVTPRQTGETAAALCSVIGSQPDVIVPTGPDGGWFQASWVNKLRVTVLLEARWDDLPIVWVPIAGGYVP